MLILIIENEEAAFQRIQRQIERTDGSAYKCLWQRTATAALTTIATQPIEAVLLGLDAGPEPMTAEAFVIHCAAIPVLIVADPASQAQAEALVAAGAVDWFPRDQLTALTLTKALRYAMTTRQMRSDLRHANVCYQDLAAAQTDLVCRFTPDLRLTFINHRFSMLFGKTSEALLGANFLTLLAESDRHHAADALQRLSPTQPIALQSYRLDVADSAFAWFEWSERGLFDGEQLIEIQLIGQPRLAPQPRVNGLTDETAPEAGQHDLSADTKLPGNLWFDQFTEHLIGTAVIFDPNDRLLFCNAQHAHSVGFLPEQIIGQPLERFLLPEVASLAKQENALVRQRGHSMEFRYQVATPLGLKHWLMLKFPVTQPNNAILIGAIAVDITKERQAEAALQAANDSLDRRVRERTSELTRVNNRLAAIFENSGDGILVLQLDGAIEQCNAAFGRLFDAIPTHFLGIQLSSLVDPEHTAVIQTAIATVQATLQNQQVLVRVLRDGSSELNALELEIGFSPVAYGTERVSNIVGIVRNVTERARSQQIIAEERNLLRTLIDAVPDYIYVKDRQHRVLLSNAAQIRLWGGPPDSPNWALGKTDADIFSQELATKYRTDEANLISSGKPLINIEERSRNEHGQEIWVLTTKVPLRNLHGEIIGLVGITRDISEAKATAEALQLSEQQLRDSQQRLYLVLDTIPVRVFWKDRNSVYLGCNRAYAEDAGLESVDAIVGKRDVDLPRTATESANFVNVDRVIIETGYPLLRYEQSLTLSNGDRRTSLTSKFPLQDAQGTIIGVLGMYEDITFLKQNQLEAQRYQADLKSVIESTSTAFILLNRDGVIRLMNRNAENIFRRAYGDNIAVGHRIYDYLPPEQRAIYDGGLERVLAGETVKIEGQSEAVVPPNYFEVTNYPVRAENGEVIGINLAYEDVTARKETERQLRFSANLQESMHEAVIGTDIEFRVRSWNKAAERIYGWTAEEMFGRDTIDVLHTVMSDNMTAAEGRHKLLEVGYWHGELLHHHRDGTPLIVLASISLIRDENGQAIGVVAVNQDITERKRTEAQLQASREEEAQFQLQLKTLHEISIALTRLNTLDEFYRQVIELGRARLGFERLGLFLYDAEHDRALGTYGTTASGELHDERDLVFKPSDFTGLFQRVLERNERVALERSIQLYVAGQPAGNGWNAVVGLWQGQNLLGWLAASGADPGNGSDVATVVVETLLLYGLTVSALLANKRTEEHLYQITQRLEIATASGGIGTWDWDVATSQVTWDDRMYALHGLQRQGEFLDREAYRAVVHPDDIDRLDREVAEIFTQLTPQDSEVRIIRPDGEMRYLRASGVPLLDNTGRVYRVVGVNWDVTSWRRGEVALMEALEKEKEVSELKSRFISIASHEFRTPLATIRATTDVLLSYRDRLTADKIDSRLRKIAQQVDHMKGLLEDVLYLARVQAGRIEFRPALGDIESLTRDIIEEFESQPEHRDRIRFESPQQAIIISMDIRLMRQLIGNLISNALKYSAVTKPVYVTLAQNTNWIVITVKDEGIGIPTEDLKHLFEPFHRAVNVGTISGTGLGLSIMKQAVELHQGSVVVESILDQGSTFSITLPIGEIGILA